MSGQLFVSCETLRFVGIIADCVMSVVARDQWITIDTSTESPKILVLIAIEDRRCELEFEPDELRSLESTGGHQGVTQVVCGKIRNAIGLPHVECPEKVG